MNATDAVKEMSRSARNRAGAVGHSMRDRALEKRLQRMSGEADRLRFENDLLREEVAETRSEHHRILDVIEARLPEPESRTTSGSHRVRWILAAPGDRWRGRRVDAGARARRRAHGVARRRAGAPP